MVSALQRLGVLAKFRVNSYRFSHIAKTLRALQSSTKTSLRIDDEGLLSLQFMMPSSKARGLDGEGPQAFIEFQVRLSFYSHFFFCS